MFVNISDSKEASNKGSSGALVHYLEKENRLDKNKEPEYWFNGSEIEVDPYTVMQTIDANVAKLGKADAKFFLVNISPSQKELAFLKEQYGEDGMKAQLKGFAVWVMDSYAQNFKRGGINSHEDLVWFAKLENCRYFTYKDKEVKQGLKQRGDRKEGEQLHIQVIVSRKDATNKIKLSPQNNSKGKNEVHSKKMGQFDRLAFKQSGESLFDELFDFDRQLKETIAYANCRMNGSLEERIELEKRLYLKCSAGQSADWKSAVTVYVQEQYISLISFDISDDIDDEYVHGKNRRRRQQVRTNR
ncbi:MAG: molybdopterin-guanine dinucleotide biosynthesis protein MobB [Chitinophagaceae bacterium]|nr:MAG: molybdopterin-guanine dinucleotide biosynthesis protein MobB [Chitinophagaceae bacterium]